MNILFLSNIATPYQLDLLSEMNSEDGINMHGYFLFSKERNRDWSLELSSYATIANYSKKINDYKNLYQFIKRHKIDKIIIGGYSLPMTFYSMLIAVIYKIDIYFWLERPIKSHNGIKKYLKEIYLKLSLSRARKIFAIGKLSIERYQKYHKNVVNLPYTMNLDGFYKIKRDDLSKEKIRFLFSGQYIDRKNIINTIEAFKLVKNKNIVLNLIGGGELQAEVIELIKDDHRINDLGFIQPHKLGKIYEKNDIFLMPSKHDGWALVINEAMAASMPIISTNKVGAVVEYIEHKINGFVCDTGKEDIKNGIEFYLNNKSFIFLHGQLNKNIIKDSLADVRNFKQSLLEFLSD